jgi:antitoxin component YwqK of YwqJK toxin-antitoxin module
MDHNSYTNITALLGESGELPTHCKPDTNGWVPNGRCAAFHQDGALLLEITYDRGVANGPYRDYWPSGRLSLEGQYVNGLRQGEWRFYDRETGTLREVLRFEAGREVIA